MTVVAVLVLSVLFRVGDMFLSVVLYFWLNPLVSRNLYVSLVELSVPSTPVSVPFMALIPFTLFVKLNRSRPLFASKPAFDQALSPGNAAPL